MCALSTSPRPRRADRSLAARQRALRFRTPGVRRSLRGLFPLAALLAVSFSARSQETGRIEGTVCGSERELAMSEVWYGWGSHKLSSAQKLFVRKDGRFILALAQPGTYELSRAWMFKDATGRPIAGQNGSGRVSAVVEAGKTASVRINCDGILFAGSAAKDGKPFANHLIVFSRERYLTPANKLTDDPSGGRPVASLAAEALTDDAGRFSLRVESAGWYEISTSGLSNTVKLAAGRCEVPARGNEACTLDLTEVPAH